MNEEPIRMVRGDRLAQLLQRPSCRRIRSLGAKQSLRELGMPESGIEQAAVLATQNPRIMLRSELFAT
jgi:hypothetical protein